jgi:methyl-accepting chemotaxis protein
MRSDSVISPEQYSIIASFNYDNKVNTAASRNALDGRSGSGIIRDYRDTTVLSSWTPVDVFDTRWALICEIDEKEAMQGRTAMRETMAWAARKMSFCSSFALLVIVAAMALVSWFIARSVSRPINNAAKVADLIASGDFSQRLRLQRSDEIGLMAKALDHMADRVAKNLRHKTGIAELSGKMGGEEDPRTLADNIVSYLAGYLDAQMAALYLAEEEAEQLILTGTYAADKIPARISFGQGLVGQAARELRMLSVTDLPDNYIAVSSSLGSAVPRNLLAAPFVHENRMMGVLEFASFSEFSAADKEFLDDVLNSIAVVFASARSRQIQELLEQTQLQAEELRQHGEEQRMTNEELAAQTVELQTVQERLEANNQALAEKTQLLEVQKK